MGSLNELQEFELSRNKRCAYDFNKLLASTKRQIGADFIRHYNNFSLHKLSVWWKPRNNESSYLHMVPSCKELNRRTSQISARLHELSSRCSQSHSGQVRMDSASSHIRLPRCGPRSPHNGQIRVGNDHTLPALQQLVSRPTYKRCRRLAPNRLASTQQLRECTLPTAEQSNKHCVRPNGPGHNNRPMVASTDVVPKTETIVSVSSNQTSKSQIHLLSPTMSHTRTCEQSTLETVCLESEWESRLRHKNLSTECTQLYKFFLADSSLKQYNRYVLQFKEFCLKQEFV